MQDQIFQIWDSIASCYTKQKELLQAGTTYFLWSNSFVLYIDLWESCPRYGMSDPACTYNNTSAQAARAQDRLLVS